MEKNALFDSFENLAIVFFFDSLEISAKTKSAKKKMKFNQIHKSNHQKLDYKSKTLEIIVGYKKKFTFGADFQEYRFFLTII